MDVALRVHMHILISCLPEASFTIIYLRATQLSE